MRRTGLLLAAVLLTGVQLTMADDTRFTDCGVPAPVAEWRNAVALRDGNGRELAIVTTLDLGQRGWILVVDLGTGESEQVWLPEGVPCSAPYGAMVSREGMLYFGEGTTLLGYDPTAGEWRNYGVPLPTEIYMSFTEDSNGLVYAGTCPGCQLVSLEPKTGEITDLGKMDPTEQYLQHLGMGDDGWLYGGVGTARMNLFAYNPATGEHRDLVPEEQRTPGFPDVFSGVDGGLYGHIGDHWYRLAAGKAEALDAAAVPAKRPGPGWYYGETLNLLAEGRAMTGLDVVNKWVGFADTNSGETKVIKFDYESEGTFACFVDNGPGGKVWGCTAHPARPFSLDPASGALDRLPWSWAWKALAEVDGRIYGASYPSGILSVYDPAQPWVDTGDAEQRNPRELHSYQPDLNAPYVVLKHPDGEHVLAAGLPGYGYRGGGIAVYNVRTHEARLLKHEQLAPDQSITALAALPDGTVLAGSSDAAGHGVAAAKGEAVLCTLAWPSGEVISRLTPVAGATEVHALALGPDGLVYGLAVPTKLFVYNPAKHEVIYTYDLGVYGPPAWNAMKLGPDGKLYLLTDRVILRIEPTTFVVEKLADAPVTISAGHAIAGGQLYFTAGSHVWGFRLP